MCHREGLTHETPKPLPVRLLTAFLKRPSETKCSVMGTFPLRDRSYHQLPIRDRGANYEATNSGATGNALALPTPYNEHFMAHTTAEAVSQGVQEGTYIPGNDPYGVFCGEAGRAWVSLLQISSFKIDKLCFTSPHLPSHGDTNSSTASRDGWLWCLSKSVV